MKKYILFVFMIAVIGSLVFVPGCKRTDLADPDMHEPAGFIINLSGVANPGILFVTQGGGLQNSYINMTALYNDGNPVAGKTIFIYGDYDVDGITSTSLCYLALKELGYKVDYYIPLRDEGYGLNKGSLSHIREQGGDLVITVDCGVSSVEEVEYANSIGLTVIITDHHDINNILPPAYAVVNPKREDNSYNFKYLAGVGTAFMLMMGLYETLGRKQEIYQYLDIVAIGTIADIVPLKAENRIFTKLGLQQLKHTNHSGLQILLQTIFDDLEEKKFNTYDVGFIIAPIFNAAGRLEDAKMAVKLLISDSMVEAREISKKLISQNCERKEVQADILEKVEAEIEKNRYYEDNVIVVSGAGFHHGVVGIVASKIVDKYYKPTIIMEEKDGVSKASCRSIEGYSIIEGLNSMREIFIKYGGHAGAAGFSIDADTGSINMQVLSYPMKIIKNLLRSTRRSVLLNLHMILMLNWKKPNPMVLEMQHLSLR